MPRPPIPTWFYALVVVRREDRFLLVQEADGSDSWYLPAGRVEPGESFLDAARRETLEESGIPVELTGVLRLEHTPRPDYTRVRVFFLARPADDTPPKTIPDRESLQAGWLTIDEMAGLPLRDPDLPELLSSILAGQPIYPLALLSSETPSL